MPPFRHFAAALLALLTVAPAVAQLPPPVAPPGNPLTVDKANLGKLLFWDEQLSSTRTISCGTCHIPSAGGADPRSLTSPLAIHPGVDGTFGNADDIFGSPGVPRNDVNGLYLFTTHFGLTEQPTDRRAMSTINAGYSDTLFWDGRAGDEFVDPVTMATILPSGAALESQALGPLTSDVEMGHVNRALSEVITRIGEISPLDLSQDVPLALLKWIDGRSYAELFEAAFGSPGVTPPRVAMAIASYERTQFTDQTDWDTFLMTGGGFTPQQERGNTIFVRERCNRCHAFELTSDNLFHYTGVRPHADDEGRFGVTGLEDDRGRMRTPSLRNLPLRAPYMHNGRFETIRDVVEFYNRGGDFDEVNKDGRVRELFLTEQEKDDLVHFLTTAFVDDRLINEEAPFDRPGLFTESGRLPQVSDTGGVAGSGGIVPRPVALEPAILGNPSFTVGLFDGLGGASATLVISETDPGLTLPGAGDFAFETVTLQGTGPGGGFTSVSLNIPTNTGLEGKRHFGRWYVTDAGGGGAVAVSPVFEFTFWGGLGAIFVDDFESGDLSHWTAVVQLP
ncbi:MAG: cytochrome c peroxidase [Acidobacteriota bacterium]